MSAQRGWVRQTSAGTKSRPRRVHRQRHLRHDLIAPDTVGDLLEQTFGVGHRLPHARRHLFGPDAFGFGAVFSACLVKPSLVFLAGLLAVEPDLHLLEFVAPQQLRVRAALIVGQVDRDDRAWIGGVTFRRCLPVGNRRDRRLLRAIAHFLVDGKGFTESGKNPKKGSDLRRQYEAMVVKSGKHRASKAIPKSLQEPRICPDS